MVIWLHILYAITSSISLTARDSISLVMVLDMIYTEHCIHIANHPIRRELIG